jgi:hypothetical protein
MGVGAAGATPDAVVRRVFGDCVPADAQHALSALEQSPLKPSDPVELQAVRELVLARAQAAFAELEQSGYVPARLKKNAAGAASSPMSLRLQEMTNPLQVAVSPARAVELFAQVANDASIPHDFIDEGCLHRAHVVAKTIEDEGVYSEKVFYRPTNGWDLKINSDKSPIGFTLAMFHVATVVLVKTDAGTERRVLDPSLGDEPLSLDEWRSHMESAGPNPSFETFFLPRFTYNLTERYDPPSAWRQDELDHAYEWNDKWTETRDWMKDSGFWDHLKKSASKQAGGSFE